MDCSPFGRLPGEIRNEIYGYLLHEPASIQVRVDKHGKMVAGGDGSALPHTAQHPARLFTVCHTLHLETREPYFASNPLVLHAAACPESTGAALTAWAHALGDPSLLQHVPAVTIYLGNARTTALPDWAPLLARVVAQFNPATPIRFAVDLRSLEPTSTTTTTTTTTTTESRKAFDLTFGVGERTLAAQKLEAWQARFLAANPRVTPARGVQMMIVGSVMLWLGKMPSEDDI